MSSYAHQIPGGACWSIEVPAGQLVRMTALGAASGVTMQLFAADRLDRLNIPDTMKSQMSACIKPPMVLMSDRGTALASVVSATKPWHDCLGGLGSDAQLAGPTSYATDRNEWRRSARTLLLLEFAKYGLGEADLHAPVNWFSKVPIMGPDASLGATVQGPTAGDSVGLRTEQNVLLFLTTSPHALASHDDVGDVEITIADAGPMAANDASRTWRDESGRAIKMAETLVIR